MDTDILQTIMAHKRKEVEAQKQLLPADRLEAQAREAMQQQSARRSMKQSLAASPTGIIAEFKRRSPSKGWIHPGADPAQVAAAYQAAGAAALSILTDEAFFAGALDDLAAARPLVQLPILRKDFVTDPYQLLQACVAGADAVLLIASCLSAGQCAEYMEQAHGLGLEVLLEIHSEAELDYVAPGVDMVGINNRHLGSFHTDTNHSVRMAAALADKVGSTCPGNPPVLVAESGISQPGTAVALRRCGFRGLLMGECFMRHEHPGEALQAFARQMSNFNAVAT